MRTEDAVDRLLQGLERLEGRLGKIEEKIAKLEVGGAGGPPPAPEAATTEPAPPPSREERADPFLPAVVRAPASRHMAAVSRALSMLGLVPEAPEEQQGRENLRYKEAVQHSIDVLRQAARASDAVADPPAEAPSVAEEIAREVAEPDVAPASAPPPPPAPPKRAGAIARAARAMRALRGSAKEPPEAAPAAEGEVVPPPEVGPAPAPRTGARAAEAAPLDLGSALQIDLERPSTGVRDYAAPILNALVLLAAAGGALYAGGAITRTGPARDAWPEIAAGIAAVACGAAAWFWRAASTHVRALLAGSAALLLNALALIVLPRLAFPEEIVAITFGVTALLGVRLVLETGHPLALLVGFGLALLLPHGLALPTGLEMPFVAAMNVATAAGALRLHRLQASVAAAALTAPLLFASRGALAAACGGLCAAVYVAQALLGPVILRRRSYSAAALALAAFAYAAWSVHVPCAGSGWVKAALLFSIASAAALVAVRLPVRRELMRGVFKAGSLLLLVAALPAGIEAGSLAPGTLFLALLFAVFALVLKDAFLRAAGALMLVVTVALFVREGAMSPLLFGAAAVAATLYAARPDGPSPRALTALLAASAHGLLLVGLSRVVPPLWLGASWLVVGVAQQVAARRFPAVFLEAGAALAAGAAALHVFARPDPVALGACATAYLPLALLALDARVRGLYLLAAELLAVAAATVAWPGPEGLLALLLLPALLPLPWPRVPRDLLRAHARLLAVVLLARALAPDVLFAADSWARTAAMGACVAAGLLAARTGRALRLPALLLLAAVVGGWVYRRTGLSAWALVAAAVALAAGTAATLVKRRPPAPPPSDGGSDAAAAEAPASSPA